MSRVSWGKGIAACVLGGLLVSAGRSWIQNSSEDPLTNAIAMMKDTLGPTAFKASLVFQMSAVAAAVSRNGGGAIPSALFAGMILLPELVRGQSSCPQLVGSYNTPDNAYDVAISGNYAYVAAQDYGLQIIDISNAATPTLAGSYYTWANNVAVSGNYAYVADRDSGLQIIDISNVAIPTLAGFYDTPASADGVAVSGNYAYVADGNPGLLIIDISNVANPTLAGFYNTTGYAVDVTLFGNYAYVADGWSGLLIIDISNVTNPTLAGYTPGEASGVVVSGNYAYMADYSSGLQIINWNTPCPTSSSLITSLISSISSTSTNSPTSSTSFSTFQTSTERLSSTSETNNTINWTLVGLISATAVVIIGSIGLVIAAVIAVALFLNKRRWKNGKQIEMETNRKTDEQDLPVLEPIISDSKSFELEATVKRGHKEIGKEYYQLSTLVEEEAREIYLQTGHTIIFPEGKEKLKYAIGKGNFGAIKIAQRIENGQYVASKKIQGEANIRASEAEANRQRKAAGENILPIYNTIKLPKALYHFMPLAGLGDGCAIQQRLATLNHAKTVTEILNFVAKDLLMGLRTLHGKGMCHLDIKPDNLVFTKEGIGYITDFGCAKEAAITQIPADALGDTRYFSPERLQACGNEKTFDGEKADMWAAGMVLLQIMKNMSPMQLLDMPGPLKLRVQKCDENYFYEKLAQLTELSTAKEGTISWVIRRLLDPNPKTRFTAQEALEAPCMKALEDYDFQREKIFNNLRKETLAQSSAVKKEEIDLNDYEVAVSAATKGDAYNFYNSEDYQQFYNTGPDRNQDYIVTAEDAETLPTPIYNNMTSDDSVYNNATPDNPIYNN